ncbi:MAG: M23 family metallopeptidase [Acidibacillus sp.]|uniref:L-Ala--D-Glu endopeptidase n=1 Tax=Sulfoacidibacillus ferrooxidans TaxID=2005001 RepID=A0A9X2AD94_9BACL|nr:M23 family metallopeptidase [Sulfoacidibacillus ferrooxidans]MCI0182097.1 L-Ala--D-Glu endopeptidase [Sulfoacidibacillus ferrooxidans]MCY0892470.1 M23 family metallopeptidase [Acidibacillus sp.]
MLTGILIVMTPATVNAQTENSAPKDTQHIPKWYSHASSQYGVHWSLLAGLDVYGATTKPPAGVIRAKGVPIEVTGYRFTQQEWQGLFNPVQNDENAKRIILFEGRGLDGDQDGKADQNNPYDRVSAIAAWLHQGGTTEQDQSNQLWKHFENGTAVERIVALSHVFKYFGTTQLSERTFPLHKRYSYSYRDTWGEGRNFGGRRSHEGTDIFASYGTPVLSTCYGYIELIGWNRLGGWRIGLRSADNTYFYYAHLSSYARGIHQGMIVRPGQVLGYVGSSGYGKPGTSGKFPPHLHFGIYKDTGTTEWAFDPYPLLKRWEKNSQTVINPPKKETKDQPNRPVT